ncbi:unnamed protein product [Prorocentrum cordatum]|uniref:Uncharacterized protein n=1 Tax=Prorocentrum cordatum TaxID=2364126 RepID=A0ABN9XRC9_9DINO|nr:unnamed protein product [Polarella glacialis]
MHRAGPLGAPPAKHTKNTTDPRAGAVPLRRAGFRGGGRPRLTPAPRGAERGGLPWAFERTAPSNSDLERPAARDLRSNSSPRGLERRGRRRREEEEEEEEEEKDDTTKKVAARPLRAAPPLPATGVLCPGSPHEFRLAKRGGSARRDRGIN